MARYKTKPMTIDVIGLRSIFDKSGPEVALRLLKNVPTETILSTDPKGWEDVFNAGNIRNIAFRGGEANHIRIATQITNAIMTCETMVFVSPKSKESDALKASDTVIAASVGKPITSLLYHPLFDDKMTIKDLVIGGTTESWIRLVNMDMTVKQAVDIILKGNRP